MDTGEPRPGDLLRSLTAIRRAQGRWLDDVLGTTAANEPRFSEVFRRWSQQLTLIRLTLLRAEHMLLHYLLVPIEMRPWRELPAPPQIGPDDCRAWQDRLAP
ncbi:MAG: hypothetical protein ACOCXJ_08930, partial [Planctomycetota bacterium]